MAGVVISDRSPCLFEADRWAFYTRWRLAASSPASDTCMSCQVPNIPLKKSFLIAPLPLPLSAPTLPGTSGRLVLMVPSQWLRMMGRTRTWGAAHSSRYTSRRERRWGGGRHTRGGGGSILAGCGCGVLRVCVMGLTRLFNPEPNSPRSCISLATLC